MEILSDATFKGNVSISGGDFSITSKGTSQPFISTYATDDNGSLYTLKISPAMAGCSFYACGSARINGQLYVDNGITVVNGASINGTLYLANNYIEAGSKSFTFPTKSGTLALTSQIPSVPSVAGFLKYKKVPIDFDVAADCTVFATPNGTGIPYGKVISLNLFKYGIITDCGAIKQVPADVWTINGGENFVVEKSSAFAISSTDGYEIRAAYYE